MTSLSLCKVAKVYSLQPSENKVLAKWVLIITCYKDIAVIGKNGTKMLKKELFDAHLYVHLDGITSLLPYYYVKLKREVEL